MYEEYFAQISLFHNVHWAPSIKLLQQVLKLLPFVCVRGGGRGGGHRMKLYLFYLVFIITYISEKKLFGYAKTELKLIENIKFSDIYYVFSYEKK